MKIFSDKQIFEGDKLTAERHNITSTELMERAGIQIFNWLDVRMQGAQVPIHVFCGIGNNGGNGLVVARHLINHGYNVETYVVNFSVNRSKDFLVNYDFIKQITKKWPTLMGPKDDFPEIGSEDIIIDAVFGFGLVLPAADWVVKLFQHFKASEAFTLAIDLPSGMETDEVPADENAVVWASHTLSFQAPKLAFFLPDTAKYTTQWEVLDVGIDPNYLINTPIDIELIGKQEVLPIYKMRGKFSHKGNFGHALIIGGSYGKIGAAILASRSALAVGAGLVTAFLPKCGYIPMQSSIPEVMVITDEQDEFISNIKFEIAPTVIGLGVGLGTTKQTEESLKAFLKTNKTPLVIDADGINLLAKNKDLLSLLSENTILTPHPKELERLIGKWKNDYEKLKKVKAFSKKYKLIIVVKGAHTLTVLKNRIYINSTGNPGLATAGTGDVLTGIITGLIAQGYEPLKAAVFGVYLHGKSADIAVQDLGFEAMTASHVIETLGDAYIDLFTQPESPKAERNEEDKKEGENKKNEK
ncbi:bifunctional ADP-dependent NAD(P)H-hydrate dehydratase/NAD(P)H-hydrate epimerase [Bizionia argentinensis JUB59]|uniref:Bifunctional NAD(P)H-hydrate repair enzyme n=1 Tax=Bizionia argentinensis JUB59 TaxID=1046627 RepID=G2EHQ5_9FLAO|nr:bifunctional ADP-dependent NAD(P)H-hydrate dehydratase/NAD(P)H-hydrate epimerase [Bizionia argentinensis]EGV42033.1 bifunctional ADP-dependent NAD(P)H-hydrate dehydratase/NAD(P)H-hydrate epimerase [Bizionia argentinensis JUB59]